MKLFRHWLLALTILAACNTAWGRDAANTQRLRFVTATGSQRLLDGVALNASIGTRTVNLTTGGAWSLLRVSVSFTHTAATTVDAVVTCSQDGTIYTQDTTLAPSGGTTTVNPHTFSNPVAGDETFNFFVDARGCENVELVFSGASAGASDTVIVLAMGVVGT